MRWSVSRISSYLESVNEFGIGDRVKTVTEGYHITLLLSLWTFCIFMAPVTLASPVLGYPAGPVVYASSSGAHLDSDLLKGGGSDDTAILQAVLDRASHDKPVTLIVDGPALVSGLNVYGNTVIDCTKGGGFFLKDGSSRALIRNAHRSRDVVVDKRITVRGCFLNGNRAKQPTADILRPDSPEDAQRASGISSNKEADGTYMAGLQFMGVDDLTLESLTIWNVRAFGALIANGERVTVRDITVDHGGGADADLVQYAMTDGLHFKGPLRYVSISGARIRVGDDALAFNADDYETDDLARRNDFGPYIRSGPITDVTVTNVQLMETRSGIRLLSSSHRIDRIMISNISGTVSGFHVVDISHWANPVSFGNVGRVSLSNLLIDWPMHRVIGSYSPFISVNVHLEALVLRNVITTVNDPRPILRLGPEADVKLLSAELYLVDPKQQAVPVLLDPGSHVDVMDLAVKWQGRAEGQEAIRNLGGSIRELRQLN